MSEFTDEQLRAACDEYALDHLADRIVDVFGIGYPVRTAFFHTVREILSDHIQRPWES